MTEPDDSFADALARLPLPRPSAARMHYAAGFAAGRRRARAWQATTGVAALLSVAALAHRPPAKQVFVDRVVYVRPAEPADVAPRPMADASSMWRLREVMLNDATVASPPASGGGPQPIVGAWMTEPPRSTD